MPTMQELATVAGDKLVVFDHDGKRYEVRPRIHGKANTVWEMDVTTLKLDIFLFDGRRRTRCFFKVPLSDPYDIDAAFAEAEVLAKRLEAGEEEVQKMVAEGVK